MANTSLERLIKSLNQGELKAFSLSIKNNKSAEYYRLFQQIKAGKEIIGDKKQNAQRRKYLYDSLLESINKQSDSVDSDILKKLLNTENLFKRQLIKESWKEANKALKLANKYEQFGFITQILEWKKTIGFYLDNFTRQDQIELSILEEKVQNKQLVYLKTKSLYMEILGLKKEIGYLPINYDKKAYNKFNVDLPVEGQSQRALFYASMTKAIFHLMLKEHSEEYKITKQITENTDVSIDKTHYLIAHLEHLTSCVCNASFDELLTTLSKLKTKYKLGFFGKNTNLELKLFYYSANYEIMSYAYMGDEERLRKKIEEVEQTINFWQIKFSKEMLIIVFSALKMGHYFLGDIKKSKQYINKMLSDSSKSIRKDAYDEALLFNMIITFDKQDIAYQENVLKNTLRYLTNNNMSDSFEYKLTKSLRKNINNKNIFIDVFKEMKPIFDKHYYHLPDGRLYSEYHIPIYLWLISKIKNKPIIEIAGLWHSNGLSI